MQAPAFVAVVGHNGAGKSTFFKVLTRTLPYQGEVLLNDQSLHHLSNPAATGLLSYLPQKNMVAFPVKVRDLVVMGLFRHKRFFEQYSAQDYETVQQLLNNLEIPHLLDREFTELSGGEQQMVWLAQLMLQDAAICLLDEPTQQLDIYHKKRVFNLLTDWTVQKNKLILCITHDLVNLHGHVGYILNLSKPEPQLEVLSAETIRENMLYLEEKPPVI
ncbi:hypothetical protein AAE02nite_42580 [Adhaeribacter aerolatus]|uniref:ABC transporter domain-containing protein n=1 Tax=Adhaeribacter aerolatus TaxID=670289 RepID=A0A512B3Q9_9BACT|nr:hypothetical protein AAE02nite_42580 [Adhaeribacter aerolatus]